MANRVPLAAASAAAAWIASNASLRLNVDIACRRENTLILFEPLTRFARLWLEANVQKDATWFSGKLVVAFQYAVDIAKAAIDAELILR